MLKSLKTIRFQGLLIFAESANFGFFKRDTRLNYNPSFKPN
jgi:hypothetical protein